MGRWISRSTMVLPHNSQNIHRRNTFLSGLWNGSGHTNRKRSPNSQTWTDYRNAKLGRHVPRTRHSRRKKRKGIYKNGSLPTMSSEALQQECPYSVIQGGRLGALSSFSKHQGKLAPIWEGPYLITKVVGNGAYKLQTDKGRDINNSWNAIHLKQYHT